MWLKSKLDVQGLFACRVSHMSDRNSVVHDEQWNNIKVNVAGF